MLGALAAAVAWGDPDGALPVVVVVVAVVVVAAWQLMGHKRAALEAAVVVAS